MNRIYKVIWSKVKNQYVVVSELAHSNGKQSSTSKISSVRGSLRAMLAALMVAGGIFSFTPAVYAAQANEASVSVLSDGIFWLQNGDNSIVIDEGNFDTYFVGAVRQADGTYTINGQVVSDKNLYNINDEIGAFVVDNNVYTGEVLDKDSHTVLSMQQRTIVNEDGFYAGNGKGTYNTLSKDGLWVGGTKDGEGFHVDNDGNVRTTGNVMVDGAFSAANGNATIAEDGTTQIQVGSSQLRVADDVAGMSSGNGSVSVSNNSATLSGAGSVVDAGLNGIILTERTGNNSVTVNQDGTTVDGNLNVEDGDFSAANGNATIAEDGTTQIQVGSSQLRVADDVAGMSSGNSSVSVSNNSATLSGAGNVVDAGLNGIILTERTGNNSVTVNQDGTTVDGNLNVENGDFSAANGNATIAEDGTTQIQVGSSQLIVNDNVAGMSSGNASVAVSNNSATLSGAGNVIDASLDGITLAERTGNNSVTVNQNGTTVNGNLNVENGDFSAANGNATIAEDGTTLIQAGSSQLIVNDNVAGMSSGNASVAVSNNSATLSGAGNVIDASLDGITLAERTGNNSVTVNQDGTTVNGNLNVENGDFSAANGNATIEEDGTTLIQAGSSQLIVNDDVAGMSSGNGSVSVSNNSATISAAGNNLEIGLNGIVTNGAFTAKGTATFEKGADMNGQKITNVQPGEVSATSTDAVNGSQMFALEAKTDHIEHVTTPEGTDYTTVEGTKFGNDGTITNVSDTFTVSTDGTTKINNVVIGNEDSSAINVGDGDFVVYDGGSFQAAGRNFIVNQQGEMTAPRATIDDVVIDNNEITGLKNTAWTPNTVNYSNSDKAATEAQLKTVSDEAEKHTTVQSGKNVTVQETTTDGHLDYIVNLNDDITLNNITANKVNTTNLEAGKADIEGMLTAGSATINGNTNITGTATVGGLTTEGNIVAHNIEAKNELKAGKADIDGVLTAGTAHVEGSATVDGTLDASNITADEGTIGGVELDNNTVKADDVNTSNLATTNANITNLKAGQADIEGIMTAGSAVIENGATVKGGLTAGNVTTTGNVQAYNINANNNLTAGKAVVNGVVQGGSFANTNESFKVDGSGNVTANSVIELTNTTLDVDNFAKVGRAATEEQLKIVSDRVGDTNYSSNNYVDDNDSLTTATGKLDAAIKTNADSITSVGGNMITGGSISNNGEITLNQQNQGTIKLTGQIHDWNVTSGSVNNEGTLTLNKTDQYGNTTGTVSISNVASTGYVGEQISQNKTEITEEYQNYFGSNDKYLSNAQFNNESGDLTLTVTNAGDEQNPNKTYTLNLNDYVDGRDNYVTGIAVNKENKELVLNLRDESTLSIGLDDLTGMGVSNSDYQLIGNGNGTDAYTPDIDGKIKLNVKDSITGNIRQVTLSDIASAQTLNTVSNRVGDTNYSSNNYVTDNDSLTTATGKLDAAIKANADSITTLNAGWTAKDSSGKTIAVNSTNKELAFKGDNNVTVSADTTNRAIQVGLANTITIGSSADTNITIDGTKGEIYGLTNKDWKKDTTSQNNYANSSKAATEAQLKDVYDAIDEAQGTTYTEGNGINIGQDNKISVQAADGGNVEVTVAGVDLKDDINLANVTASSAINVGTADGTQVKIDGTTRRITGLSNTTWNEDIAKAVTENKYGEKGYVATQGQLNTVYEAAINNAEGTTYEAGDGVKVENSTSGTADKTISVDEGKGLTFDAEDGNKLAVNTGDGLEIVDDKVKVDVDGSNLTLSKDGLSLSTTLTGLTSVTANEFKVGNKTYISSAGIDANSKKITNVDNGDIGESSKDAINGGQLYSKINEVKGSIKTYEAGDGISISGNNNTISVNADKTKGITVSDAGVAVNAGDGLTFDDESGALKVATGNGLTSADGKVVVNAGDGITVEDGSVAVKLKDDEANLVVDNTGLSLSKDLTGLENVSSKKVIVGADIGVTGITIDGKKITGLDTASIADDKDAVNKEYVDKFFDTDKGLAVQYDDKYKTTVTLDNTAGVEIKNVKTVDWLAGSTSAANVGLVYSKAGSVDWNNSNFLDDATNLTVAADTLDSKIGSLKDFGEQNVLKGTQSDVTTALKTLNEAVGAVNFDTGVNYIGKGSDLTNAARNLDTAISAVANAVGVRPSSDGTGLSTTIDFTGFYNIDPSTTSVVTGMRDLDTAIGDPENLANSSYANSNLTDAIVNLDDRVSAIENPGTRALTKTANTLAAMSSSQIGTLNAISNMDMNTANTLASISPNALKAVANLSAENAVVSDSEVMGSSAANSEPTRNPEPGDNYDGDFNVGGTLKVTDDATFDKNVNVGGKLDVKGEANFHEKATFDKDVSIGGTLEMNGNRITGLAAGKEDTDAVNVSQLNEVRQDVADNRTAINTMGNQVNRLSNRIDKVGAGAAALAALHPLDFDPDDKLSFAAGYGNYAGENAVAVGAFYQPNEDTMFSVGGTFGNDENMVNAGVSFKLGQKSNVSRSRVSMAKELVSLRDEVAQLKALMAHAGILPSNGQFDTSALFPDVPENHWAYEYVHELGRLGILEGYADGNFEGDRMMTRYEMAAIVYRAMQKGVNIDSRMLKEFEPELKLIRVDVVARDDDGNPTIERVRVNEDTQQA